jgi:hypothetical protein
LYAHMNNKRKNKKKKKENCKFQKTALKQKLPNLSLHNCLSFFLTLAIEHFIQPFLKYKESLLCMCIFSPFS